MILKYETGSLIQMKKKHPCGKDRFKVIFAGSDVKLVCTGCGKELLLPRVRLDKMIKKVLSGDSND